MSGTLVGIHQRERLVEVNDYDVDLEPADHMAFFVYEDRPGMVGAIGRILGEAEINIARDAGRARPPRRAGSGCSHCRQCHPGRRP